MTETLKNILAGFFAIAVTVGVLGSLVYAGLFIVSHVEILSGLVIVVSLFIILSIAHDLGKAIREDV